MSISKRAKNENEFDQWEDLSDGRRRYWFDVVGKSGGFARYIKYVHGNETTLSFVQEIYYKDGILIEIHEKYPVDKGHKKI